MRQPEKPNASPLSELAFLDVLAGERRALIIRAYAWIRSARGAVIVRSNVLPSID